MDEHPSPTPATAQAATAAGLPAAPAPTEVTSHTASRVLELGFADGSRFRLSYEFLRVMSPSAEVRGHGPGQETLQTGKREVTLAQLAPVGHYALGLHFSDGHNTGIYSWDYLYHLGRNHDALWADYLRALAQAGASRDPVGEAKAGAAHAAGPGQCGSHGAGGGCGGGGCGQHGA